VDLDVPTEASGITVIDEERDDGYYYGYALLTRQAAKGFVAESKLKPSELEALASKLEETGLKWSDAQKTLAPAGKGVKYPDAEEGEIVFHATNKESCVAVLVEINDEKVVDSVYVDTYMADSEPTSNDEYARCALYALGIER
jgi:hypothetical protein